MIYIIHRILVLLKNHLNYFKYSNFECFLRSIIDFYFFLKKAFFFSQHIILENLRSEEDIIIIDIRNLFRLRKEPYYTAIIKNIRNLFILESENKAIKGRILGDIKNFLSMKKKKIIKKPVRVSKFWSNNYIEYESNSDRNKRLSVKEYLN